MMAGPMPVRGPGGQGPRSTGTGMRGPLARSDTYGKSSRHDSHFIIYLDLILMLLLFLNRSVCIFTCILLVTEVKEYNLNFTTEFNNAIKHFSIDLLLWLTSVF